MVNPNSIRNSRTRFKVTPNPQSVVNKAIASAKTNETQRDNVKKQTENLENRIHKTIMKYSKILESVELPKTFKVPGDIISLDYERILDKNTSEVPYRLRPLVRKFNKLVSELKYTDTSNPGYSAEINTIRSILSTKVFNSFTREKISYDENLPINSTYSPDIWERADFHISKHKLAYLGLAIFSIFSLSMNYRSELVNFFSEPTQENYMDLDFYIDNHVAKTKSQKLNLNGDVIASTPTRNSTSSTLLQEPNKRNPNEVETNILQRNYRYTLDSVSGKISVDFKPGGVLIGNTSYSHENIVKNLFERSLPINVKQKDTLCGILDDLLQGEVIEFTEYYTTSFNTYCVKKN